MSESVYLSWLSVMVVCQCISSSVMVVCQYLFFCHGCLSVSCLSWLSVCMSAAMVPQVYLFFSPRFYRLGSLSEKAAIRWQTRRSSDASTGKAGTLRYSQGTNSQGTGPFSIAKASQAQAASLRCVNTQGVYSTCAGSTR